MLYEFRDRMLPDVEGLDALPRPPGAVREMRLADLCTGCGDCAAVCPNQIIELDKERLPVVISIQSCGLCGLCADVCTHGAIEFTRETRSGLTRVLQAEASNGPIF